MIKKRKHKGIRKLKSANRTALESKSRSGKSDRLGENLYLFNTKIGENYLRFQKNISYIVRDLKGKFHRQSKKGRTNFDRFIENQNRLKQKTKQAQRPKSALFQRLENFTNRVLGRVINKKLAPDKTPLKIKSKAPQEILPQPQSLPSIDPKPKPKPNNLVNQISISQKPDLINTKNLKITNKVENIIKFIEIADKQGISGLFQLIYLLNSQKKFKDNIYKLDSTEIKKIPLFRILNTLNPDLIINSIQDFYDIKTGDLNKKKKFEEKIKKVQLDILGVKNKKYIDTILSMTHEEFTKYYLSKDIDEKGLELLFKKLEKGLKNDIFTHREKSYDITKYSERGYLGYSAEEIRFFINRFRLLKDLDYKNKIKTPIYINKDTLELYDKAIAGFLMNLSVHKPDARLPNFDISQENRNKKIQEFKDTPRFQELKTKFNLDIVDEDSLTALYIIDYFDNLKQKSLQTEYYQTIKNIPIDPALSAHEKAIREALNEVLQYLSFFYQASLDKALGKGLDLDKVNPLTSVGELNTQGVYGNWSNSTKMIKLNVDLLMKDHVYKDLSLEDNFKKLLEETVIHELTHPIEFIDNYTAVISYFYILDNTNLSRFTFARTKSFHLTLDTFREDYTGNFKNLFTGSLLESLGSEYLTTTTQYVIPILREVEQSNNLSALIKHKDKFKFIKSSLDILDHVNPDVIKDDHNINLQNKIIDNPPEINMVNFNNFSLKDKLSFFSNTQYFTTFKQGLTENKGSIKKLKPFLESYGIEVTKNNKDLSVTIFNKEITESTPTKLAKAISDYLDSDNLYFYTKSGENVNKFIQKKIFEKESQEETNLSYYLKPELAIRFVQNNKLNMTALVSMVGLAIKNKNIKEGNFLTENLIRKELDKLGYNSTLFKENLKDILPLRDDIKKIQLALLDLDNDEIKLLSYFLDPKNRNSILSLTSIKTPEQWDSFQNIFYKIKMGLDNDLFIASPDQYFSEYKIKEYVKFAGAVIDFDYYNQINNPKANKDTLKVFKEVVNYYLKLANNFTSYDFADYQQNYLDILDEVSKFSQTKSYHELVKKFITNNKTISKDIPLDVINLTLYFYSVMNDLKEKSLTGDALLKSSNLSINIKGDDSIKALVTERFRATLEYYGIFFDKIRSKEKLGDDYSKIPNITTINEVAKEGGSGYWRRGEDAIWVKSELLPDRLQRNVTHEMTHPVEVISKESFYTGIYGVLSNVDITKPLENKKHLPVNIKVTRANYSTATYSLERAKDYFSTEILTTGMEEYLTLMLELDRSNDFTPLLDRVFETSDHLMLNLAQIKKIKKHLGL